jgi:ATPase subunit of ABC transporter with duplicated ATPase domains
MEFTRQNAPISDKKFASLERMRTNVLEKAKERGLKIEGKINNHFDELIRKEKRKIIGKEVRPAAIQFRKRRKQTEADAKREIRNAKKWKSDIAKEEKRRRKEVTYWKAEAQKWKKETQRVRLRRNARTRERRAEENRRITEGKWKGKRKFAKLQLKVGDKLSKIWEKPREILEPILAKHAIKGKVRKYVITPNGNYDPAYFLTITEDEVKTLINSETEPRNVRMSLVCEMVRSDPKNGEEVSTIAHFGSKNHKLIGTDDTEETQDIMREKMLKSFSEYQRRGSGWRLRRVTQLEIHIGEFRPLRGKKHEPLPESIASKKAIINMKNDDDECFKWAVTRALNPVD